MRLIDADALKKDDELAEWLTRDTIRTGKMLKAFSELFVKKIDDAPTVNAVSEEVYTREYNLRKDAEFKAYKLEKALEQEPCEDAISRQEVVGYLCAHCPDDAECFDDCDDIKNIKALPYVKPQEAKTGHWEWVPYDSNPNIGNWHCSECRCVVVECVDKNDKGGIPWYKYCPQCGIRMESEETE